MVTALLIAFGAVLVVQRLLAPDAQPATGGTVPRPGAAPSAAGPSVEGAPTTPADRVSGRPTHLRIPAIGVDRDLLRLGLNADRTVEVPSSEDADFPGWYRLGPTPGQRGSAVILGHVDSVRGPAVFAGLRTLVAGDRVNVVLSSGAVAHFRVQRVETFANEDFPAQRVYAGHGRPTLQLVTCGGRYDPEDGYQSNVVAFTRLVRVTPA